MGLQAGCGDGCLRLSLLRGIGFAWLVLLVNPISLLMAGTLDGDGLICFSLYKGVTEPPQGWFFYEGTTARYRMLGTGASAELERKNFGPYEEMLGTLFFKDDELGRTTHLLDLKKLLLKNLSSGLIYQCEMRDLLTQIKKFLQAHVSLEE